MAVSITIICIAFIIFALYVERKIKILYEICKELNERNKDFNRMLEQLDNRVTEQTVIIERMLKK